MGLLAVQNLNKYAKPVVHLLLAIPFLWLLFNWWLTLNGQPSGLGFNPQETSNRFSGDWTLRILLISLSVTPFSLLIGSRKPIIFRRLIGLWAFFYVCIHMLSYVWLDMLLEWGELWMDILKRQYITVGMLAFILLLPLTFTSTSNSIKRLGARRWRRLHQSIYLVGCLAVLHFFMMRKGIQLEPLIYCAILLLLLFARLPKISTALKAAAKSRRTQIGSPVKT